MSIRKNKIYILALVLFQHSITIAQTCHRYSDADDCAASGSFLSSLVSLAFVVVLIIIVYAIIEKNSASKKEQDKEEYWRNIDREIDEAVKRDEKRQSSLEPKSQEVMKDKIIIKCKKCSQSIRVGDVTGWVTCSNCKHRWLRERQ